VSSVVSISVMLNGYDRMAQSKVSEKQTDGAIATDKARRVRVVQDANTSTVLSINACPIGCFLVSYSLYYF